MATTTSRLKRGVVASFCTLALAAAGMAGTSTSALAEGAGAPGTDTGSDASTLTIYKLGGDNTGVANDGTQTATASTEHPAIVGAKYKLYKAGLNLKSGDDWVKAAGAVTAFNTGDHTVKAYNGVNFNDSGVTLTTNNQGVAALPAGTTLANDLYIVEEIDPGTVVGTDPAQKAGPVQTFIITLPLQDKDGDGNVTGYLYNPSIYAKSSTPGEKGGAPVTEKTGASQTNGQIEWTITVGIPASAGTTDTAWKMEIFDNLSGLKYVSHTATINGPTSAPVAIPADKLVLTGKNDAATKAAPEHLTWTLDEGSTAGLLKANAGGQIKIKLVTSLYSDVKNPTNVASATYNGKPGDGTTPVVPSGKFQIVTIKAQEDNNGPVLQGAKYEIYGGVCTDGKPAAGAQKIEHAAEIITGSNGIATVTVPVPATGAVNFCVSEIQKPAGYTTVDNPNAWQISNVSVDQPGETTILYTKSKAIIPALPVTGANGRLLLITGGSAAVLMAGGLFLAARRRESEEA